MKIRPIVEKLDRRIFSMNLKNKKDGKLLVFNPAHASQDEQAAEKRAEAV
jgi:hypothetical protein